MNTIPIVSETVNRRKLTLLSFALLFSISCSRPGQKATPVNLPPFEQYFVYVTVKDGLRLRKAPSEKSEVIALLDLRSRLKVLNESEHADTIQKRSGKWLNVISNSLNGWVFSPFTSDIPFDSEPSKNAAAIDKQFSLAKTKKSGEKLPHYRKILELSGYSPKQKLINLYSNDPKPYEACLAYLYHKNCQNVPEPEYVSDKNALHKKIIKALAIGDKDTLLRHSNCTINISCYNCDSFSEAYRGDVVDHIFSNITKANLKSVPESDLWENRQAYNYPGSRGERDYFAIMLKKAPKGWYLYGLVGLINRQANYETCGYGG